MAKIPCFSVVALAILGIVFPAFAQDAPAEASPTSMEGARIWIEAASSEPNRRVFLHIRHRESVAQEEAVVFDCEVHASTDLGLVSIHLTVTDAAEVEVHRVTRQARIPSGLTVLRFEWNTGQLPEGKFEARFELAQSLGRPLTWSGFALRKLAPKTVEEDLDAAGEALAKLLTQVSSLDEGVPRSPYLQARTAIAELFFEQTGTYGDDWPRIKDVSRYVERTADSVRALLTLELYPNDSGDWQDLQDPAKTRASAGGFSSSGKPVFLIGIGDSNLQPSDLETMGRLHLNFGVIDGVLPPAGEAETALAEKWDPLFKTALDQHLSLMFLAAIPNPAMALEELTPGDQPAVSPDPLVGEFAPRVAALGAYLHRQQATLSLALKTRLPFRFSGDGVRREFIDRIREIYSDRTVLNRAWRTRYASFDDIRIWTDFNRAPYRYDWLSFYRGMTTSFLEDVSRQGREMGLNMQPVFDRDLFSRGEALDGVDYKTLIETHAMAAVIGAGSPQDPVYAMAFPGALIQYALLRSIAPELSLIHLEPADPGFIPGRARSRFEYVHTLVWELAIEGASGFAVTNWHDALQSGESVFGTPEGLEGLAVAGIDLNRLAPIVTAFQRAPASIAVLWSDSSKLYNDGEPFLASAVRAFEGVSFAGEHVRFITEDQCAAGDLQNVSVLVIPDTPAVSDAAFQALQEYAGRDGIVIRSATPIPYDPWGHSRTDVLMFGENAYLVRGRDESTEYMHALDAAFYESENRVPRPVNSYGYPLEGVKSQFVEHEGRHYLYIVNLRKTSILCTLEGDYTSGRDLIRGRNVTFPKRLRPLTPMLIRLNEPLADATLAANPD